MKAIKVIELSLVDLDQVCSLRLFLTPFLCVDLFSWTRSQARWRARRDIRIL